MIKKNDKIICIFGGSGFLGHHITQELARAGYRIKIATRYAESAYELKTYGDVGQIVAYPCNYKNDEDIKKAVEGCYAVINLIGILYEKGKSSFERVHVDLAHNIALISKEYGVKKYIHLSALGIDKAKSKYAKSKLKGEKAVQDAFPAATILRPSVIFGADDNFFNMFAKLSTILPALPLIGGGKTKFQPIYVGDIAESIVNVIDNKSEDYSGKIYELGGPEIVTFKEIYERLFTYTQRHKVLISLPFSIAKIQGTFMGMLPRPMLTSDQVRSLQTDNIVQNDVLTLSDLDVIATAMDCVLPTYLSCYRRGGRFADKKKA